MTAVPDILTSESQPLSLQPPAAGAQVVENIEVTIPQQALGNWCWAAVAAGLETFFGVQPPRKQCRIVSDVVGAGCCPPGADVQQCNVPRPPQRALGEFFERRVNGADGGTSFAFIEHQIVERKLPVLANLGFRGGRVGHLVVISGFRRTGAAITLFVWDPYTGTRSEEPLRQFQAAFRDKGRWRASYTLRRPNADTV